MFLILPYSTLNKVQLYSTTAGIQGLGSSEQARRVTAWRRERRWEMVELNDPQQLKMEGQVAISLAPVVDGTQVRLQLFEHSQPEG